MDNFLKPSSVKLGWCNSQRDVGKALKKKKKSVVPDAQWMLNKLLYIFRLKLSNFNLIRMS